MIKNNNFKKNRNFNHNRNNNVRRISPSDRALELIAVYQETLCMGYNEETWTQAARILNELSMHIDLDTHRELGSLMTEAYTDGSLQSTILGCERITLNIQKQQTKTNR
jgi:uncharacterized protein (DUF1800 family)